MEGTKILVSMIVLAVTIPLSALLLFLTLNFFNVKNRRYSYALLTALIIGVISLFSGLFLTNIMSTTLLTVIQLVVLSVITALLLNEKYNIGWGKSFIVWLIWTILNYILAFVLVAIVAITAELFTWFSKVQ